MEYFTYILIILGIMILCLLVFREVFREEGRAGRGVSTGHSMGNSSVSVDLKAEPGTPGEFSLNSNVPIPWGWPGNDGWVNAGNDHAVSDSLHRFMDHLISEKQTIESREYLFRRDESLRAMIEDRFGQRTHVKSRREVLRKNSSPESGLIPGHAVKSALADVRKPWGW